MGENFGMTGNEQNVVKGQGFLGNSQHVQHSVTGFMLRVDFTRFCYRAQGKLMNAWVCIADLAGRRKPVTGVTYRPAPQYIP
tara:strand:+ start:42 stop:287 length:246 start_codon:yes stop_codon:yes gene_type:complete